MVVDDQRKCIFLHIPKTGGTSIRTMIDPNKKNWTPGHPKHATAEEAIELVGREKFDEYTTFAFVRNPWDRYVSNFAYWRKRAVRLGKPELKFNSLADAIRFSEGSHRAQVDWVTVDGKIVVDFIGRYENFESDVKHILGRLGFNIDGVAWKNRTQHKHYRELFTPQLRKQVQHVCERDAEAFGYSYE